MFGLGHRNSGRNQLNVPAIDVPAYIGGGNPAFVGVGPVPRGVRPTGRLTAGWLPGYGSPAPQQQIGRFDGSMLNQYPAYLPGVQRHSVREFGDSRWFYPMAVRSPLGNLSQTVNYSNLPGAQRHGSAFGGLLGPINSRRVTGAVLAQQLRQSGLQAMGWAAGLNPLNNTGS